MHVNADGRKTMHYKRNDWANLGSGEVVRLAADGHKEAWDELHRRYSKMIARVARCAGCASADVPDVEQAVWARLIRHIGRLHQPDAVAGWLAVVTRRECLRLAGKRLPVLLVDDVSPTAVADDEPLATVLHAERRAAVRRAVATLPRRRRQLLETMLDHPDMGYDQLATRLSMPRGSIGPTRQRGLDDLRQRRELVDWQPYAISA
jgi:RNA polymerase sigma factor (sigma-70 family)